MRKTVIQEALQYLLDLNESLREWDPEDSFLDNKNRQKIKILFHKGESKWSPKMLHDGWNILKKHAEYLEDYKLKFDEIERPDYSSEIIIKGANNLILVEKETFIVENYCNEFREYISDEIIEKTNDRIKFKIKLKNIFSIFKFFKNNKLQIDHQAMRYINYYLNKIPETKMFKGLENLDGLNINLKPFQEIGTMFLLFNKRAMLADQMGLGKTVQSIAATHVANAYPCVIVCPSSLKFNWVDEFHNITDKKVENIKGKRTPKDKDVYIINYESVHKNKDFIKSLNPKSIIFDESHYLKNPEAKRTISCLEIINHVEYRFLLTGTAVLNMPVELISQLKIIRRLEEHFESEEYFIERFCGTQETHWGKDNTGATNLEILAGKLREGFFLRRLKKNVEKELPKKIRTPISIDITENDLYRKKLLAFSNLNRDEKISHISSLRQASTMAKIPEIKKWIDSFLLENKKLVVFAYHRSIQKKLAELYPDSSQVFSEDDIEENVKRFKKDSKCRIIICSLKIGSIGLNLTDASNVLFCEMDWCPSINEQAEDRCHRMGQIETVNAWYFLGKNSIDEHIWNVCERKKIIVDKVYQNPENTTCVDILYSNIINDVINLVEEDLKMENYFSNDNNLKKIQEN
jgi:SWI/SNF-related matrix-associated actin-dependent regulator 1 of chromatin subfamily A